MPPKKASKKGAAANKRATKSSKAATKKAATSKGAAKKPAAKDAGIKKPAAKKTAAKKTAAKKTAAKKTAAKKTAAKKPAATREVRTGTRTQPGRKGKTARAPNPLNEESDLDEDVAVNEDAAVGDDAAEDEDATPADNAAQDESSDDEPLAQRRKTKLSKAAPIVRDEDAPAPTRTTRSKRPAPGGAAEDPPASKRPRRGRAPSPDQQDEQAGSREGSPLEDTVEDYPDTELTDVTQLASAEVTNIPFTLRTAANANANVTLRFRLQVYADPEQTTTRLFYRLRCYLRRAATQPETEAGYIHAYRIAKSTLPHPTAETTTWRSDFFSRNIDLVPANLRETAICLRALFRNDGTPAKSKIRDPAIRQGLADQPLLFVQMIHVRLPFERQGLLAPLLRTWQRLLQELPEWFAFRGNAVLVPGLPDNAVAKRAWGGKSDAEVEDTLKDVYGRQGFEVWADGVPVGGERITVMGRMVPFVDAQQEAGEMNGGGREEGEGEEEEGE